MPRLVAAPDKFRGTATAREAAAAIARAATDAGWACLQVPMSDGGEGFVDVLAGGAPRRAARVHGPLGGAVDATWAMLQDGTAIVESAAAVGRGLLAHPKGDEPVAASSAGLGELLAEVLSHRPTAVVVGVGGTATTDGGQGCVQAFGRLGGQLQVPLVVACDVDCPFLEAPRRFAPQKGASPDQVRELDARLAKVARAYASRGTDVVPLRYAGAGGGLAGGLAALGGTLVSGATLVAERVGLAAALDGADLVVTGEGRLDDESLEGKVVGTVLAARGGLAGLVVAGSAARSAAERLVARGIAVVSLDTPARADGSTLPAIERCVGAHLAAIGPR